MDLSLAYDPHDCLYRRLGVKPVVSGAEIRSAYRRRALETHPDRNPGDSTATRRFQRITEAYEVLSDRERRARYDMERLAYALGQTAKRAPKQTQGRTPPRRSPRARRAPPARSAPRTRYGAPPAVVRANRRRAAGGPFTVLGQAAARRLARENPLLAFVLGLGGVALDLWIDAELRRRR